MLKKAFLILSTIAVGAIADSGKSNKEESSYDDNDEVNANEVMKNYLKTLPQNQEINIKVFKELLTSVAHRGEGKTFKGSIDLKTKAYDKVMIILYKTLNSQKPLQSNIKDSIIEERHNQTYIHIPTQNIKEDKIIIKDKEGNVLIEYDVIK